MYLFAGGSAGVLSADAVDEAVCALGQLLRLVGLEPSFRDEDAEARRMPDRTGG